MKVLRQGIFVLMLMASTSGVASDGGKYLGVWSGTLTEMVVAGQQYERYPVTLTMAPNAYRIDYESLQCGGSLHLLNHRGRFFRFRDELNYGLKNCDNGGRTEVHFISPELAAFQWFDQKGVLRVEGHLKRHRQTML